jgi:DNA-binding response OmpR family regulator
VLDCELSLLSGAAVAAEMKKLKPQVPTIMLTDHLQLTDGTLESVDALVTKSDGPHFLWATVHFILNVKPAQHLEGRLGNQTPARLRRPASHGRVERRPANPAQISKCREVSPLFARSLAKHSQRNCPIVTGACGAALSRFERLAAL